MRHLTCNTVHFDNNRPKATSHALRGGMFYVSHSGGKDSQAMYILIYTLLSSLNRLNQLVIVHADLGQVEWLGTQNHIEATTFGKRVNVVRAIYRDGSSKTLLDMVEKRAIDRPDVPSWPSSAQRYCTSDLKRGPIEKFIRHDMARRGSLLAYNCMGLRAEESVARAKKSTLTLNKRLSKAGRTVYDWLPIHNWTTSQVFSSIAQYGQQPHYAYALGNERLSCVFCIFGSTNDLLNGAKQRPQLARQYIELERRTGYSMFPKLTLIEVLR